MAPRGFEPPTPGLKVQCSNQTELRSRCFMLNPQRMYGFEAIFNRVTNQTELRSR